MKHSLTNNIITQRAANSTAAGTAAINSDAVDTQGAEGVRFTALFGALTATQVTSMKLQYSDDGATGWADIADSNTAALADADGTDMLIIELNHPQQRYVRAVVNRGTANAVLDGIVAELYNISRVPVTQDAAVIDAVILNSAVAGTA